MKHQLIFIVKLNLIIFSLSVIKVYVARISSTSYLIITALSLDGLADHEVRLPHSYKCLFSLCIEHAAPVVEHLTRVCKVNMSIFLLRWLVRQIVGVIGVYWQEGVTKFLVGQIIISIFIKYSHEALYFLQGYEAV